MTMGWLCLAAWNAQIVMATTRQAGMDQAKVDSLDLGDFHTLHLTIWNKEIEPGTKDVKLKNFSLTVRAYRLSAMDDPVENLPTVTSKWFQVRNQVSRYYHWNVKTQRCEENSEYIQDNQQKLTCNGIAVSYLSSSETFASLEIRSQVEMARNDSLFIGEFHFQPNQPGLYRLLWQVSRNRQVTDTLLQHVYFKCPPYTLALQVKNERLLHHISYDHFGIPLVTSAFFEEGSEMMSADEPDRIFRNTFIATAAKRMACEKYVGELPILYDKTVKEKPEIGKARAEKLQAELEAMTGAMRDGKVCETAFTVRPATTEEWERFVKPRSEISPEQFSQENRVVPLVLDLAAQRQVFAPLEVLSNEKSDEVVLTVKIQPQTFLDEAIQSAKLVVTDSLGQKQEEEFPFSELPSILRGDRKIQLKSGPMLQFFRHGRYTARLHLAVNFPDREIWSNPVAFFVERHLNVMRDEIFALNRYDKPDFVYALDHERVNNLAAAILQAAQDTLLSNPAPKPPDALVLVSGHACVLGEVVSRLYNLGLSFGRALFLRKELINSIRQLGSKYGIEVQSGAELCAAKPLITKFIDNPEINALLKECLQASDGKALEISYEDYLQRIIREKVRHFEAPSAGWRSRPQGVPDSTQIRQRIEEIKHVLPGSVLTLALKRGDKTINVHFVAVGFGAAVPFYRHFDMPAEMREVFAKMGIEAPRSFYGDDRYPAGRLMNRRVEVNLIW
jgi:outer membrane protein OmpA-like peptidoglycan-associated protein